MARKKYLYYRIEDSIGRTIAHLKRVIDEPCPDNGIQISRYEYDKKYRRRTKTI
jgi:hypothetical protein